MVKCEIVRIGGGKLSGTFTSVVISLSIAACLSICTFAAYVNSYSPAFFKTCMYNRRGYSGCLHWKKYFEHNARTM